MRLGLFSALLCGKSRDRVERGQRVDPGSKGA